MTLDRVSLEFVENEKLTKQQEDDLKQLKLAVYPQEALPRRIYLWLMRRLGQTGRRYKWISPQWSILVMEDDKLIASVGLVVREIISNGASKKIGGMCRLMTHPAKRKRGLASHIMREAARRCHDDLGVSYALGFCRPHLIQFYKSLNWEPFKGKVFVNQPEGRIDFTSKGAMVLDIKEQAPLNGILDLNGLPW